MSSISVSAHAAAKPPSTECCTKSNVTLPVALLRTTSGSCRFSSSRRSVVHLLAVNSGCLPFSLSYFPSSNQYGRDSKSVALFISKCSESDRAEEQDEWLSRLPEKDKALYSHSLPCIEAWLRSLGLYQSEEDRAVWFAQKPEWHAQLSLDITDLHVRYFKSGPGNLEKDVERRFSYALSREDIEKAVLGGP